jgi:hypothetical protein
VDGTKVAERARGRRLDHLPVPPDDEPLSRRDRKAQSHEIAQRLRPELDKIATPMSARIKVAEVPLGPPVLHTLVAEVYGPDTLQAVLLTPRTLVLENDILKRAMNVHPARAIVDEA